MIYHFPFLLQVHSSFPVSSEQSYCTLRSFPALPSNFAFVWTYRRERAFLSNSSSGFSHARFSPEWEGDSEQGILNRRTLVNLGWLPSALSLYLYLVIESVLATTLTGHEVAVPN